MISEKKKISNARWDSKNMRNVAVRLTNEKADEFKRLCEANGESMHLVLKRCIDEYIDRNRSIIG